MPRRKLAGSGLPGCVESRLEARKSVPTGMLLTLRCHCRLRPSEPAYAASTIVPPHKRRCTEKLKFMVLGSVPLASAAYVLAAGKTKPVEEVSWESWP